MSKTEYNPKIFAILQERCRQGTLLGKALNLLLYFWFTFARSKARCLNLCRNFPSYLKKIRQGGLGKNRYSTEIQTEDPREWDMRESPLVFPNTHLTIIAELSIPQCTRYRVEQKAEILRRMGWSCTICSFTDVQSCLREIPFSAGVIFYRTPLWPPVDDFLKECQRLAIPTLYDIDDLVFDTEIYAEHPVFATLKRKEAERLLEGGVSYQKCLISCDHAIASTHALGRSMGKFTRGKVFVYENALDDYYLELAGRVRPRREKNEWVTLFYGSGTTTHDEDFALIVPALLATMRKFPEIRLVIHGYLRIPPEFKYFGNRVVQVPFLESDEYFQAIGCYDINLSPLVDNAFNRAKSNIKYLEAALLELPTVASAVEPFAKVISTGVDGYLAATTEQWISALEALVQDQELRNEIGRSARKNVLSRYHPEKMTHAMAEILKVCRPFVDSSAKPLLMVVNDLYAPSSFGGATILVEQLVGELRHYWDVVVVCSQMRPYPPEGGLVRYEHEGVPIFSLATMKPLKNPHDYIGEESNSVFARLLTMLRPDVVHFHCLQSLGAKLVQTCLEQKIPTAVTLHDAWWICERQFMNTETGGCFMEKLELPVCADCKKDTSASYTFRRFFYLTRILTEVPLLLTPSEFQRQLYAHNLPSGANLKVNKNGVKRPQKCFQRSFDPDRIRFAFIGGGGAQHKGYFLVKEIFEQLDQSNYELILVDIHQRLGARGIQESDWRINGELVIRPPFAQSELDAFYGGVDVLLFPSQLSESFGLAVREALLRNVWVLATRSGGVGDEIRENENGNMVEIGDKDGFRRLITSILVNPHRLKNYQNPYIEEIRTIEEQAMELNAYLLDLLPGDEVASASQK